MSKRDEMAEEYAFNHILLMEKGKDRWSLGINHHPRSLELMRFLIENDFRNYNDYFCWKMGGDGDNGETLMYQMDAFFEATDPRPNSQGDEE